MENILNIKKDEKNEKEIRKQYNATYYSKNKAKIAEQISKKEQCCYCKRLVSHQNIFKHQKSTYCANRRQFLKQLELEKLSITPSLADVL